MLPGIRIAARDNAVPGAEERSTMTRFVQRIARLLPVRRQRAAWPIAERQDPRWGWAQEHPELLWSLVTVRR